jgi:branched-chain amino acid transport system substrate-binding protein
MNILRKLSPRGRALLALGLSASAAASCTVLVYDDAEQCASDDDCAFLGAGYLCNPDMICARGLCATNADCEAAGLAGYACGSDGTCQPPGAACQTAQQCIAAANGAPAACVQGSCVTLTNEYCQEVVPASAIGDDDTIYIGWMGPLTGDFESIGVPIKQSVELALEEFDVYANGIPGGTTGKRRVAMIACHDLDDHLAVARHLAEVVKVPAIIGPAFSGITLDVTTDVTIPAGTLVISASATSPAITDIDDDNLVWRTAPSDALQAKPLSYLVGVIEDDIRTALMLQPSDDIRVAAASKGDAYGQGLFISLTDIMRFNNRDVADNLAANAFLAESYEDPSTTMVDFSEHVQSIVAFAPHLVLPLGTNEGITEVMGGVEATWPTGGTPPPRPRYLFPDGGRLDELLTATQTDADLRGRVKGTVPGKQGENYQFFALRFEQRFGRAPGTFAENGYDAAYLVNYAIVASGAAIPTGADIAAGLGKMTGGQTDVVSGPNDINEAVSALGNGGDLEFEGASGPLDFNDRGEAASDIDIWCVDLDNQMNAIFVSSGQFYDAEADDVVGVDSCPSGG